MPLTEQQKTDVIAAIAGATGAPLAAINEWIANHGATGEVAFNVRRQIAGNRKPELLAAQYPTAIDRMVNIFCSCTGGSGISGPTVDQCDTILATLQDAEIMIEAKKTELGG